MVVAKSLPDAEIDAGAGGACGPAGSGFSPVNRPVVTTITRAPAASAVITRESSRSPSARRGIERSRFQAPRAMTTTTTDTFTISVVP